MGMHADLDLAMVRALREMIELICARSALTREQAYQFCSLAVDFRITQTVNGEKGVHGMLRKTLLLDCSSPQTRTDDAQDSLSI
jgi:acetamidase/formamidase